METLAIRIRQHILKWAVCEINGAELAGIWGSDDALSDEKKREAVRDFAMKYNFLYVVDYGLAYAVFR